MVKVGLMLCLLVKETSLPTIEDEGVITKKNLTRFWIVLPTTSPKISPESA